VSNSGPVCQDGDQLDPKTTDLGNIFTPRLKILYLKIGEGAQHIFAIESGKSLFL
jgi:hypothetical protein